MASTHKMMDTLDELERRVTEIQDIRQAMDEKTLIVDNRFMNSFMNYIKKEEARATLEITLRKQKVIEPAKPTMSELFDPWRKT